MQFEFLSKNNVNKFIEYLDEAFKANPSEMVADCLETEQIYKRVTDEFYNKTKSILAIEKDKVVGQIEYHFYGCIQDGTKMAYVDWVHVLPAYRKQGIASALFNRFEKDCLQNEINQYYLICCEDEPAKSFYDNFDNAQTTLSPILRRILK